MKITRLDFSTVLIFILSLAMPNITHAAIADLNFEQCRSNLIDRTISQGFSPYITKKIIPNLSPVNRVLALDKKQPEFAQSFHHYISTRITSTLIKTGKQKLKKHQEFLNSLESRYGVPPQYLVSFWGLETHYGKHKGKMSVLNSLATLACDQRRSEFFTLELLDLFTLIENKSVTPSQLQGSWAGAMGHLQFMPSALLKYATDGDGDGIVDIWQSEKDALTTAANYLQKIGWRSTDSWGQEVSLPDEFHYEKISYDTTFPSLFFHQLGIKPISPLKFEDKSIDAELYLPAGHRGPAFLLYANFNVIMKWNLSKSYALSVGILADTLIGKNTFNFHDDKQNKTQFYRNTEIKKLQVQLNALGFDSGEPDGIWGPNSRRAIRAFQLEKNLIADGYPNPEVFSSVRSAINTKAM